MEEERRLCYVGMTRAEQRLYSSWARYRRCFEAGSRSSPSVRASRKRSPRPDPAGASRYTFIRMWICTPNSMRFAKRSRNLYTGKTPNSVENIRQFFASTNSRLRLPRKLFPQLAAVKIRKTGLGSTIEHAKYGRHYRASG